MLQSQCRYERADDKLQRKLKECRRTVQSDLPPVWHKTIVEFFPNWWRVILYRHPLKVRSRVVDVEVSWPAKCEPVMGNRWSPQKQSAAHRMRNKLPLSFLKLKDVIHLLPLTRQQSIYHSFRWNLTCLMSKAVRNWSSQRPYRLLWRQFRLGSSCPGPISVICKKKIKEIHVKQKLQTFKSQTSVFCSQI